MKSLLYVLTIIVLVTLAACGSPADGNRPTADQVATVVHMTLQVLSSDVAVAAMTAPAVDEPTDLTGNDVSAADGSVAYVLENQLLPVNADGSNRRLVLDGGPKETSPWVTRPVFSRDGRLLDKTLKVVKREYL